MNQTVRGVVQSGGVVLDEPLDAPDGTEVVVFVAPVTPLADRLSPEDFRALPFFGMHREVTDGRDGVEIVNEERAKWQQRPFRQD